MVVGHSIRSLHPPKGSVGVLIFWKIGSNDHGFYERNNDNPIVMKKVTAVDYEKLALLYVYYYVNVEHVPEGRLKVVPSEGYDAEPMDVDTTPSTLSRPASANDPSALQGLRDQKSNDSDMDVDTSAENEASLKRKGPDTRTVVLAPEVKKSKLGLLLELVRVLGQGGHQMPAQPGESVLDDAQDPDDPCGTILHMVAIP